MVERAQSQPLKVIEETPPRVCQALGQVYCSSGGGPVTRNQTWAIVPSSDDTLHMRKVA